MHGMKHCFRDFDDGSGPQKRCSRQPAAGRLNLKRKVERNMLDEQYDQQDREVIGMVNDRTGRTAAKVVQFVPKAEYEQLEQLRKVRRIGNAAARAGIGLIFIAGMARGLMDPGFATLAATACLAWAAVSYWRG